MIEISNINLTSTSSSGFLETDFDQIKDLVQDSGVTAVTFDTVAFYINGTQVTSTAAELNILDGVTATTTEINYVSGVTSAIQTQLDAKAPIANPTFTGEIGIGSVNVSETELGILEGATLTTTEINYVDGVTSAIQTQLDAKVGDTGNESIAGVKTFSSFPVTPSSAPSSNYEVSNKKYVDDNAGGAPEGTAVKSTGETGGIKFLREDGDNTCSWQVPAGSGDVSKVGTPVNDQVGVWTGDGTIEGTTGLTYSGTALDVTGNITVSGTVDGIDVATDVAANTAKVTCDTTNVTSAGALMDSEVDADIKTLSLPANTTISTFGASLVDDADAATARTTLGVDASGTDNSTDVSLAGTPDYITISGQVITRNTININTDTNLSGGTNLTLATGGVLNVDDSFIKNNADDTSTGKITAANFAVTADNSTADTAYVPKIGRASCRERV